MREIELAIARNIAGTVREPLVIFNTGGSILAASKAFYRLIHLSREETENRNIFDPGIGLLDMPGLHDLLESVIQRGESFEDFRLSNGEKVLLCNSGPVNSGISSGLFMLAIEELKVAETTIPIIETETMPEGALRDRRLLQQIINEVPIGIALHEGPDFITTIVNAGYYKFAYGKGDIMNRPVAEVWHEVADQIIPLLQEVYRTGIPFHATDTELTIDRGNGPEKAWFSFSYLPFRGEDEKVTGILVWSMETTRYVLGRKAAEEAKEQAERRSAELDAVFESIPEAVYIGTLEGITQCNNLALHMLGASSLEDLQQRVGELALKFNVRWPDTGRHLSEEELQFARALKGEIVIEEVLATNQETGEDIHIRSANAPIMLDGKIIGAVAVNSDITARKIADEDLRRKTALLEATINSIPDGYIVYGPDRSIIRMNDIAEKILGFTEEKRFHAYEERINQLQAQTPSGEPFPLENIPSNRAFNGETVRNEIIEVCRPEGHYWLSVSAAPIIADDGKMHGVVMEFADITDLKTLEKQLENERDLSAAVIQTSGALITVLDREGKITRFNKASEELTGYTAEEVRGRSLFDLFIPPEEREDVTEIAARLFAGESRVDFENHWITKKGEKRFIRWRNSILHDKNRKPVYAVATGIDITDRKRIEDAWRASEEQLRNERNILRMVVNNLPYSFILLSPDLHVEYTNETINNRFGLNSELAQGKSVHELFPTEVLDLYLPLLQEVKETGIPFSGEISYHVKGSLVTNIPNIVPLYDEKNEIQHLIILSVDITERKQMEDAIRESEEKFRNMFESHGAIMLIIDPQSGEIIDANASAEKFYGYSREELQQMNINRINHLSNEEIKKEMQEAEARKRNYFVFEHQLADGSVRPVEIYSTPVRIESRTLLFSVIHDISERMKAEKALSENESSLRRAQEIAHLGSWELDLESNRLTWSDEIYRIFGLLPQEFKATYEAFLDHVHPDDRNEVDSAYTKSVQEGLDSYEIEHRVIRKSTGEIRYVHEKCQHVRNSNGQIIRSIGMVHDITDRKQAENALLQRSEELAEANKELESFSYSVSHDLRSPLTAIHGFSNLLLENYSQILDENGKGFLNYIIAAGDKMAAIIDDLLKMARITRETMNCQKTDLSLIAGSIVDELRKSDPQRKALINIADAMPAYADTGLMTIALTNLIGNAWKYTGKNAETRIDIGVMNIKNENAFYIRDNGAGFDMKFYHRLFHPFERLHPDSEFSGTGIGLTIVQKIIHRHGGRIWAESEPDKGSVFYFTLKCR